MRINKFLFLLALFFILALFSILLVPLKSQNYANTEVVSVEKNPQIVKKLRNLQLDLLMEWNGRIYIILNKELGDFTKFIKENIPYRLETHNFSPSNRKALSIQTGANGAYHSYQEVEADLLALEESYPHIAKVYDIGDSLEGRNIYALKISDNVTADENEVEVLFIGCHHAREWISVEVPLLLGQHIIENYGSSAEIKNLVDQSQVWIVPLLNPDGLEYSIHFYRYWRKNRRNNDDGSYGVDPNRNYDYKWSFDDEGSSPNPFSNVYRGKSPFSEPETQAIRDLCGQRNFQSLISYHNYSQIILYPWGYTDQPSEKDDLFFDIAANMSKLMREVNGTLYMYGQAGPSLYLTNGDTTDWALGIYGIPAFTIELPPIDVLHGGFFNAEEEIQLIFNENLPAALFLIDWSIQNFNSQTNSFENNRKLLREKLKKTYSLRK